MKYATTLILLIFSVLYVYGQPICTPDLERSNILSNDFRSSTISSLSNLYFEGDVADPFYNGDGTTKLFDLGFARGVWAGGIDPAGNLKLAASGYGTATGGSDFIPGPIIQGIPEADLCDFYRRVWTIDNFVLASFIDQHASGQIELEDIPLDILEWPANGNPHIDIFAPDYDMAPFFDNDQDGIYDPMAGDYPVPLIENPLFIPDQFRFFVFNDLTIHNESQADPLAMEFHVIDYVVNCIDNQASETSIFTRLKYIYKGVEPVFDFRIGIWDDTDLGCFEDDYVGSLPDLNTNFVYNSNGLDIGVCPGITQIPEEYGVVRSLTLLNTDLEGFLHYYNAGVGVPPRGQTDPIVGFDYYNYLDGKWLDGTEMTIGGTGLNPGSLDTTAFAFSDSPLSISGWSMQAINAPLQDLRTISSFNSQSVLTPGETAVVDFVDYVILNDDQNRLDIFENYMDNINILQQEFAAIQAGTFNCGELPEPCQEDCVWPGDVDDDGIVTGKDLVILGQHLGQGGGNGPARATLSSEWFSFESADWNESLLDGSNAKFADVDGSGEISNEDFVRADNNLGETRIGFYPEDLLEENQNGDILTLQLFPGSKDSIDLSNATFFDRFLQYSLEFGVPNQDLEEPIHGLSFAVRFDTSLVTLRGFPGVSNSDFQEAGFNSEPWEEIDNIQFGDNKLDVYFSNLNGENITSSQRLTTLDLYLKEDAKTNNPDERDTLIVKLYNVYGVNAAGDELNFGAQYDTIIFTNLIFDPNVISSNKIIQEEKTFTLSPNPTNDYINIKLNELTSGQLTIYSMQGEKIDFHKIANQNQARISVHTLDAGLYILTLDDGHNTSSVKFVKTE